MPITAQLLVCLLPSGPLLLGSGDEASPPPDQTSAEAQEADELTRQELVNWKFWLPEEGDRALVFDKQPVLRWSNPGVGRIYGGVFLGTVGKRPRAAVSIYRWYEPWRALEAELVSLAEQPLRAARNGETVWRPDKAGVSFQDVPEAPSPAENRARRAQQMRALARDFSAFIEDRRVNKQGEEQPLRLLTQPITRYDDPGSGVMDGMLFAFVLGTDPEILLMIEARDTRTGRRWQYAPARMNNSRSWVVYGKREVWNAPHVDAKLDNRAPYHHHPVPLMSGQPLPQ